MPTVTVYRCEDPYESWVVEMIDPDGDGTCEKAIFFGGESERQAPRVREARVWRARTSYRTRTSTCVTQVFMRL